MNFLRTISIFQPLKQIHNLNLQALGQQQETSQGKIQLSPLKRADLSPMKSAFVSENILGPPALKPEFANPLPQSLLKLLPLHLVQFGATLLKHILLIRRVNALWRFRLIKTPGPRVVILPSVNDFKQLLC